MINLIEHLHTAPRLWLDYDAYAGRLLANGAAPWGDVDALIGWYRKAQGLLHSDVIAVPLADVAATRVATQVALRDAMASGRRPIAALKTVLADDGLRGQLRELLGALASSFADTPIVLTTPSPRRLINSARQLAGLDCVDVDDDAIDNAALLLTDFLRTFGDSGLAGVLLIESVDDAPATLDALELYRPLLNVGAHYRWAIGTHSEHALPACNGMAFAIATSASDDALSGLIVDSGFWNGDAPRKRADGQFLHATLPADAQPESVLARLALLR